MEFAPSLFFHWWSVVTGEWEQEPIRFLVSRGSNVKSMSAIWPYWALKTEICLSPGWNDFFSLFSFYCMHIFPRTSKCISNGFKIKTFRFQRGWSDGYIVKDYPCQHFSSRFHKMCSSGPVSPEILPDGQKSTEVSKFMASLSNVYEIKTASPRRGD